MPRVTLSEAQVTEVVNCLPSPRRLEDEAAVLERYGDIAQATTVRERAGILRGAIEQFMAALLRYTAARARLEVATVSEQAHCGKECCWWSDGQWWHSNAVACEFQRADDYCPRTGERLLVVDGQPVVEPRPSPEYVRLLEDCAAASDVVPDDLPKACLLRRRIDLIQECWGGACNHPNPPLGCFRALAAERQQESGAVEHPHPHDPDDCGVDFYETVYGED